MLTFWRVVVWIGCGGLVLVVFGIARLRGTPGFGTGWLGPACYMFCLWAPFLAMVVLGLIAQWAIKEAAKAREEGRKRRGEV